MSTPAIPERRACARSPQQLGTFAHRFLDQEVAVLRLQIIDQADLGVGMTSMIPFRIGERVALGLQDPAHKEIALCQVQHSGKSTTGQFHAGAQILERITGDLAQTRVPPAWKNPAPIRPSVHVWPHRPRS